MKKVRLSIDKLLFAALAIALAYTAYPTGKQKQAGGLRLSRPVETPSGVHLSWTGGQAGTTYSIYRKDNIEGATWERIAVGLSGASGTFFYPLFTLDRDISYRIQAEAAE